MNWYWLMYAFVVLEKFQELLITLSVISGIVLFITTIFRMPSTWVSTIHDPVRYLDKIIKWWWVSFIGLWFFIICAIIIPTKKEVALIIIGGSVGEFVENDDNVKKLPADLFMLLRKEILEEVSDLPIDIKKSVEEKLGVSLETEKDKLKKLSKEQLMELYLKQNKTTE